MLCPRNAASWYAPGSYLQLLKRGKVTPWVISKMSVALEVFCQRHLPNIFMMYGKLALVFLVRFWNSLAKMHWEYRVESKDANTDVCQTNARIFRTNVWPSDFAHRLTVLVNLTSNMQQVSLHLENQVSLHLENQQLMAKPKAHRTKDQFTGDSSKQLVVCCWNHPSELACVRIFTYHLLYYGASFRSHGFTWILLQASCPEGSWTKLDISQEPKQPKAIGPNKKVSDLLYSLEDSH